MDIRSLFEQTMSSAKNLFTFRTQKNFFTKLARYNFFNKRIQTKHLFNTFVINLVAYAKKIYIGIASRVKEMNTQIVAIFTKVFSSVKNGFRRAIFVTMIWPKKIWSKTVRALSHVYQVRKYFSVQKIQYSWIIGFVGGTMIFGFCAHTYFKIQKKMDALESLPAIKALELRLTQTESSLRDAQAQLQAMSGLEHEVKRTASKLGEAEESLKERLAQAEHKVEEIDAIGASLKLTGLKSLMTKNKQKAALKNLNGQSDDLNRAKEKIRKEVKRQMKALEAGDNNSF